MDICEMHSESEEGVVSDFEEDFTKELCNLPHVLKFICKLRNHIKRQRKKINKLRNKLNEQVHIKFLIKYSQSIVDISDYINFTFIIYIYTYINIGFIIYCQYKLQYDLLQKHQNLLLEKTFVHCGTQTNPLNLDKSPLQDWDINNDVKSSSIVDQVKHVAESALLQSGFVYEETSGMYYDYNTGYYYDTVYILYYT